MLDFSSSNADVYYSSNRSISFVALSPGDSVNVIIDDTLFKVGVVLTYPDLTSDIDIFYTVQLEKHEQSPETDGMIGFFTFF